MGGADLYVQAEGVGIFEVVFEVLNGIIRKGGEDGFESALAQGWERRNGLEGGEYLSPGCGVVIEGVVYGEAFDEMLQGDVRGR